MIGSSARNSRVALALAALALVASACGSDSGAPGSGAPGGPPKGVDPGLPPPSGRPVPGNRIAFGTQGPWAVENRVYAGASGIREGWIVDMTTDEAQNRWIATPNALYLLTPAGGLWRFDETDGLHLGEATGRAPGSLGWVKYCDMVPVAPSAPCTGEMLWGGATQFGIRSVAGGGPNEVFVGYHGGHTPGITCDGGPDWCDPLRHSGKMDRVRLNRDGSITVDRFDSWINDHNLGYWHNRTPFRLLYDHFFHPGTLYAAMEHGIVIVFPDRFVPYTGGTKAGLDAWLDRFLGDHLHAEVCYHLACASGGHARAGDFRGLWLDAHGNLWQAGQFTAGLSTWDSDPLNWWGRWGAAFLQNFGDPYVFGKGNEPVFKVPMEGDDVNLTAVSVCPDGRVWFATRGATAVKETVAVWDPNAQGGFRTFTASSLGLGESAVEDMLCLPDGRLVLAGLSSGAVLYDPAKNTSKALGGLPSAHVNRLTLDTMVSPWTLMVSTDAGAAVFRQIP